MKEYERLRRIRKKNSLSLEEVAKILGVTKEKMYSRETGEQKMPTKYYVVLAKYYNLSLDYIVGLTNEAIALKND